MEKGLSYLNNQSYGIEFVSKEFSDSLIFTRYPPNLPDYVRTLGISIENTTIF